jgi:hypothetical protein
LSIHHIRTKYGDKPADWPGVAITGRAIGASRMLDMPGATTTWALKSPVLDHPGV